MGAIDIGLEAIDRASAVNMSTNTLVGKDNPANGTGTITDAEIYLATGGANDVWVGTFSAVGDVLTCHDSESLGSVTAGSKQSFSGLTIDVIIGEYFGTNNKSGTATLEYDATGFADIWFYPGEVIDPSDSQSFSTLSSAGMSLFGTGSTPGWAGGDPLGVAIAGIAKINGVALADITKVNGVA